MPNWCNNHIRVSGGNPAEISAFAEAMREGRFFDHVIPVPEDLQIVAGRLGDPVEQAELERKTADNVKKYGAGNWYDFCVSRWGTKWDAEMPHVKVSDDGVTVESSFDSAWAPPLGVADALVARGFDVTLYYHECGMAFCGKYENGDDDCYDYSSETSATVRDAIGEELDDFWAISEQMASLEEDQQDDLTEWYEDGVEQLGLESHRAD